MRKFFLVPGILIVFFAIVFLIYSYYPQYREDGTIVQYNHGPQGSEWIYPGIPFLIGFFLILGGIKPQVFKKFHHGWQAICKLARKITRLRVSIPYHY